METSLLVVDSLEADLDAGVTEELELEDVAGVEGSDDRVSIGVPVNGVEEIDVRLVTLGTSDVNETVSAAVFDVPDVQNEDVEETEAVP